MRYTLLIYVDQNLYEKLGPEEQQALTDAYNAFGERFKDKIKGGEALLPTTSATTVRVREGKTLATDGPFAETKEQLGGYYLVQCENLDEAIQIAAQIPDAARGSIEVRPVMEFE
ncbi:MAG TPA: YciI family protein [Ktedonobacterales bacterium]